MSPAISESKKPPSDEKVRKQRRSVRYPAYNLADSVEVARRITEDGGGIASRDRLAAFLSYSTTNSGAYLGRIAAARLFNLITTQGSDFLITPLAQEILMPVYGEQARQALVKAFFNVPLFKEIYEEYNGKPIPPEFGMKNFLRTRYGLNSRQSDEAYRTLIESADTAGFFTTRNARTHLIIPQISQPTRPSTRIDEDSRGSDAVGEPVSAGGSGDGGNEGPISRMAPFVAAQPTDMASVRAAYVSALIEVLKERSKEGELDDKLMERIERLLDESKAPAESQ